jgi:hypothetical protein
MPLTELKKWATTVYMPKAVADLAQVPAASATIDVYKRGATVSVASGSIAGSGGTATISVYDIGSIVVNDDVYVGTDATKVLRVTLINSAVSINVRNDTASAFSLAKYDRLVPFTVRPTLYNDVTATDTKAGSPTVLTDANGFVEFFTAERYFDYKVTKTGLTTILYEDEESGQSRSRKQAYDVRDFVPFINAVGASDLGLTAAIATVPEGSVIYLPGGQYNAPTAAGWTISKALTLEGDSTDNAAANTNPTVLLPYNGHFDSNGITINVSDVHLKNLYVGNLAPLATTSTIGGDGIRIGSAALTPQHVALSNVVLRYNGRHGLNVASSAAFDELPAFETQGAFFGCDVLQLKDVNAYGNRGTGFRISGAASLQLTSCWAIGNRQAGIRFVVCPASTMASCATQDNGIDLPNDVWRGQVEIRTSHTVCVTGLNCEDFQLNTNKRALIVENSQAFTLVSGQFVNGTEIAGTTAISWHSGSRGGAILGWMIARVTTALVVNAGNENTGNFFSLPYNISIPSATCPGTITIPSELNSVANSSGGNFSLLPRTDQTGGQAGVSYIGAIQLPMIDGTGAYTSTLKPALFIFDGSAAAIAAKTSIKYYDGVGWRTLTAT